MSAIVFPELPHLKHAEGEFLFSIKYSKKHIGNIISEYAYRDADGNTMMTYYKTNLCHWMKFSNLTDFYFSLKAKEISYYPCDVFSEETLRHLLLDQVLPRCLAHQGKIMLHASAVKLEKGLILFLGDSGAGKSTLAGNFHQVGAPAISDDCLMLKDSKATVKAIPAYGGLRLWDDSIDALFLSKQNIALMAHYSKKKRLVFHNDDVLDHQKGIPILAVFVLAPVQKTSSETISLERLSNREAFIAMMKQSFQLDVTDLKRIKRHMGKLGHIVPRLPFYRLSFPHDYSLLPIVRQKILETLS